MKENKLNEKMFLMDMLYLEDITKCIDEINSIDTWDSTTRDNIANNLGLIADDLINTTKSILQEIPDDFSDTISDRMHLCLSVLKYHVKLNVDFVINFNAYYDEKDKYKRGSMPLIPGLHHNYSKEEIDKGISAELHLVEFMSDISKEDLSDHSVGGLYDLWYKRFIYYIATNCTSKLWWGEVKGNLCSGIIKLYENVENVIIK